MSIISKSPTVAHPKIGMSKSGSASQNTSVGSGSRPTKSKFTLPTSAPSDPKTLGGRKTAGSL
jgi:hypothetical protein